MQAEEEQGAIPRLRQGTLRIQTSPGTAVHVQQQTHAFQFGTPVSGKRLTSDEDRALDQFVQHWFNSAVVPVKWASLEPRCDQRSYAGPDAVVDWCAKHHFFLRGHCLFYAHRIHVQEWVRQLPKDEALRRMQQHARDTVRRYRGRIPEYDLNNELLDGSWYRDNLGEDILRRMADWVLEEDPNVRLYVNEHDIITGGDIDRYVELIERLLSQGVPIRGIGCQGHLDPPFDLSKVKPVIDRLAQFGLPIKITEFDAGIKLKEEIYRGVSWIEGSEKYKDLDKFKQIVEGYPEDFEEQKAAALDGFFRIVFAHPAIEGIYIWGFQEGRHWRTRGESFRRDLTPLPAGAAMGKLLHGEWWTDTRATADNDGFCPVRAFYGKHRLTVGEHVRDVELRPDTEATVIDLL